MKQRFRIGDGGALIGRDGQIYGHVSSITLDLDELSPLGLIVGQQGGRLSLEEKNQNEEQPTPDPRRELSEAIDQIWAHYVEVMQPRRKEIDSQGRGVIRDALAVATEDECIRAISGCKASPFHMGDNDRRKKYNRITQILRGKSGGKTTREQIDMFLEILEKSPTASGTSLPTGVVESLKNAIRSYAHTGAEQQRAEKAKATLIDKGVYSDIVIDLEKATVEFIR